MTEALIEVRNLNKNFGGLVVTNDVSMDIRRGEIHALIGPNGAGKSTLVNQIAGELHPNSGQIVMGNEDLTIVPTHHRVRHGLVRTFQISSVLSDFTVFENALMAALGGLSPTPNWWKPAVGDNQASERAIEALNLVQLDDQSDTQVTELSYGERRHLELAMALALKPKVLLLDEPMAGVGPQEVERLAELFKTLRADRAILLIEHDMDVVFALADRVSVLVEGVLIATASPNEIRKMPEVQSAYFGEGEDA
ncbi:MAG: ABC transporter ATP-binding protein [Pseudomonadota bacterium]